MIRRHVLSFYSPPGPVRPFAPQPGWTAGAANVPAVLQPIRGTVEQSAAGREVQADYRAFVPAGTVVAPDDGAVLVSGVDPAEPPRYRVREVAPRGAPWDTELLLGSTPEEFP